MRAIAACCLVLLAAAPAAAQQALPSPFAVDTVAAVDQSVDQNGNSTTGVIVDGVASLELGGGFEAIVRPFAQRLAATEEWNLQVWVATLRYERTGDIGVRIDGGLIPSPVGLANLMLRPHLNPTIAQPASLFAPLPLLEPRGPRANLLGAVYAYGANATISGTHWDARVAAFDTSPLRPRRVFAEINPPRFANVTVGGGVTPFVGVRVGGSWTRGQWQRAGESPAVTADRHATILTIESDVSFRYTRLLAEWVRDEMDTSAGMQTASGWFVQGQQTLAPRWFAAGRVERMSSPVQLPTSVVRQYLTGVEETIGYRLTPELTIRGGHRARRGFGRSGFDNQVSVSVVWWKRWM